MKEKIIYIVILAFTIFCFINTPIFGGEIMAEEELNQIKMSYRIEGAYSPYRYIQLDISDTGEATLDYQRYIEYVTEEKPREETINFTVKEETIKKLLRLYKEIDFFNIEVYDLNRDSIRVTDVGTTTLNLNYKGKERNLSYGYIEDNPFWEILNIYWNLINEKL